MTWEGLRDQSHLIHYNPDRLHYGVAVTDVDGDGRFEFFITGYGCANRVMKWDGTGYVDIVDEQEALADKSRYALGVAAGDMNGDGREEIYVLNTEAFAGRKRFADRLFKFDTGRWHDLFSLPENGDALNLTAGRSVAVVDRRGTGKYSFFVANYGGPLRCYELDENGFLADIASYLGLALVTGGRSLVSLPLVSDRMDIFAGNENGPNYLFRNRGNGTFEEIATEAGLSDRHEHARGVAAFDADGDGRFDLVVGNWDGAHRMFLQTKAGRFTDSAQPEMARPSQVRTVIAADFDNDGYEELFFNNIGEPNRLFGQRDGVWTALSPGDALEAYGLGTGAAVADLDGDGRLELLIAHGEQAKQPLTLYHGPENENHWLRVLPLTASGAPARGAIVTLTAGGRTQIRAIDAGSGYLCQMEPVAHFGLGPVSQVENITVRWPDGAQETLANPERDRLHRIPHPV